MATKKDLVEAYSFSRRRLVTAFVSGAPGGREVEPTKPGRTLVGGLALAVLLMAGAAIAGVLKPNTDVQWDEPGLILSKEKGAAYVILEPDEDGNDQVRPVINVTSAQLILGADVKPQVVPQSEIDTKTPGADIGILGAPATVPDTDFLVESGWTACTGDGLGVKLDVREDPDVSPAQGGGVVVEAADGSFFVIGQSAAEGEETGAYRFALPDTPGVDNLLDELGLPFVREAPRVPTDWLDLFPTGGDLAFDSFGLQGFGTPSKVAGRGGLPDDAKVGDYFEIEGVLTVVTATSLAEFSPFARAVYLNTERPREPRNLGLTEPPDVQRQKAPYGDARWPEMLVAETPAAPCAQLVPERGEKPRVVLAASPGEDASATEVDARQHDVTVQEGRGAYVLSGGWDSSDVGEPFLVDSKGASYALLGTDAVENLGFGSYDAPVVPRSWMQLFDPGAALSVNAALCPPTRPGDTGSQGSPGVGPAAESAEQGGSCE
jgi:type VII secretion protein EccB